MQLETAFPPLVHPEIEPKVLILGSMPGVRSLEQQQYYAHPQNSFWWIMSELLGFDKALPYSAKIEYLVSAGIMVWDVAYACHRPGSLDSNIDSQTFKPNDFGSLFSEKKDVRLIAFNGQAARKLFKQHVERNQSWDIVPEIKVMPSTSPAYAAMRKEQKLEIWCELLEYLS